MKKERFSILRAVLYVLLSVVLVYNLVIIFKSFTNPEQTPDFLGIKTYVVASGSMKPILDIGDVVVVKSVDKNDLEEGDIISFRDGQKIVTHRIYSVMLENGDFVYRTKGDFNNTYDKKLVKYEDIEGELFLKIPYVGNCVFFMQKPVIIVSVIVAFYIYIFFKGWRKDSLE